MLEEYKPKLSWIFGKYSVIGKDEMGEWEIRQFDNPLDAMIYAREYRQMWEKRICLISPGESVRVEMTDA